MRLLTDTVDGYAAHDCAGDPDTEDWCRRGLDFDGVWHEGYGYPEEWDAP